jgi:hypothetical protein
MKARLSAVRHIGFLSCLTLVAAACSATNDSGFEASEGSGNEYNIVGGSDTTIKDNPWQISLQTTDGQHFCGGSILSRKWVLTANHCIVINASQMRIVAGATRLSDTSSAQIRNVKRVVQYPGYVDPSRGKDVALLELASPLDLSKSGVQAIAIMTDNVAEDGATAEGVVARVTGWGTLSSGGDSPDTLQTVNVPLITNEQAQKHYPEEVIGEDQLAAAYLNVGGKDACQGDSGGPLTVDTAYGRALAGVVSWGYGCADGSRPGMYARVSHFQSWLYANAEVTLIDNNLPDPTDPNDPDPVDPTDPDPVDPTDPDPVNPKCGWSFESLYYACGGDGPDPAGTFPMACPSNLQEGGSCGEVSGIGCCDANGDNWYCSGGSALVKATCGSEETVDPDPVDPPSSQGACGWDSQHDFYGCGGTGVDPSGTPMGCPENLQEGAPCGAVDVIGCCDQNGSNWFCGDTGLLVKDVCGAAG